MLRMQPLLYIDVIFSAKEIELARWHAEGQCSHLHVEWNSENLVLLHFKVNTNGRLVVPFKYISTVPVKEANLKF